MTTQYINSLIASRDERMAARRAKKNYRNTKMALLKSFPDCFLNLETRLGMVEKDEKAFEHVPFIEKQRIEGTAMERMELEVVLAGLEFPITTGQLTQAIHQYLARQFLMECDLDQYVNYLYKYIELKELRVHFITGIRRQMREIFPELIVDLIVKYYLPDTKIFEYSWFDQILPSDHNF